MHKPQIMAYANRAVPLCCAKMSFREYFGDLRTANAKRHILRHLEATFHTAAPQSDHEAEYQIKASGDLNCPVCKADLDLSKDDFGLLLETEPSVIQCKDGHEFEAYFKDNTLFMWLDGFDSHSPFSTSA